MKFSLLILIVGFLLFFGCISSEIKHKQLIDGSAELSQTLDMSVLLTLYSSSYGGSTLIDEQTACKSYKENLDCKYDNGVLKLSKKYGASEAFYTFETKDELYSKKYRLTVDEIDNFFKYASTGSGYYDSYSSYSYLYKNIKLSDPDSELTGKALGTLINYTYIIEMPGQIVSAEGAIKVEGNTATFDLVKQLKEKKPILVISEIFDSNLFIMGAVVFALLIAVAAFLIIKRQGVQQ